MGCGCKKKNQEQQIVQQPPANIRLTEVQKPVVKQQTEETPQTTQTTN
jgi:hypothetical protein